MRAQVVSNPDWEWKEENKWVLILEYGTLYQYSGDGM